MAEKINENPEQKFSAQSLSMTMLGLQKQKSTSREVQELLKAITLRMDNLDGQAIGNCLYSMQKMSSDEEGVLLFLSKLAPRILTSAASKAPNSHYFKSPVSISSSSMKPQELANALWGLQGKTTVLYLYVSFCIYLCVCVKLYNKNTCVNFLIAHDVNKYLCRNEQ